MDNWKILEGSHRIGGRVLTSYFNGSKPEDYQYQEIGPMRFPVSIRYADKNETLEIKDSRMVFQLADALNEMNGKGSALKVEFIPWIQSARNSPISTSKRRPDGTIPGHAEAVLDPSLAENKTAAYSNVTAVKDAQASFRNWTNFEGTMKGMADNVFRAHKKAIADGLFDYSEAMYLREVLNTNLDIVDQAVRGGAAGFKPAWLYDFVYFSATEWKTIDKGLSRLPAAFGPLVLNQTTFGIKVQELSWDESAQKITVHWRAGNRFDMKTKAEFDYAVVTVPFTNVRLWRLPDYHSLLLRAIKTLHYETSCKVALHYKTRFWEHLEHAIVGGCGTVNIPGIDMVCYPSYKINSTGPGVMLASYVTGDMARSVGSLTEAEHVALVQRAMIETHGKIAEEQFTGLYIRKCWEHDEFYTGAWSNPLVGQQELYLPAYYRTDHNTVFVGEHTSVTHAWVFSALESAVRGATQLLLDMGLVDEAKKVSKTWMARWMRM